MKRKEIEKKKRDLDEILKEKNAGVRLKKLKALAREVGASVIRMEPLQMRNDMGVTYYVNRDIITESEIVHNIQFALQTETMVDMCKTASRNFWIALAAMLIAGLAMLAAWAGVIVNWRHGC